MFFLAQRGRNLALFCLILFPSLALSSGVTNESLAYMRAMEVIHPYCEGKVSLQVANEYFVEIANDLPGVLLYNEMIGIYRKKDWSRLDEAWAKFRGKFATSPLVEAATFLMAESQFERIPEGRGMNDAQLAGAEKTMREVLLNYPNSTLAPVLTGSVADFWLERSQFDRSLALFEAARQRYSHDPLACVFQMGIGESNFRVRDWKAAERTLSDVLGNCKNLRLRAAAAMRLADSRWLLKEPSAVGQYEKMIGGSQIFIERFFPFAFYNIGEMKYRDRDYAPSKFYFTEFLKHEQPDGECVPYALKRLADIAFRMNEPWDKVVGEYLAVRDRAPLTDVGRFSYIHALLLGLKTFPKVEYGRRMKIIDEQIDLIKDESFRETAYLEKGLSLLDTGERSALDYLVRLNERSGFEMAKGPIGTFVRQRLLEILEDEVSSAVKEDPHRKKDDSAIFGPLEAAFPIWLKGTSYEDSARNFYYEMLLRRFDDAISDNKKDTAMDTLDRWVKSSLWSTNGTGLTPKIRLNIGSRLLELLVNAPPDERSDLAILYLKHEPSLRPFVDREYSLLWAETSLATGDTKRIQILATSNGKQASRGLASPDPSLPKESQPYLNLVWGESLAEMGKFAEAESALSKVKSPALIDRALRAKYGLFMKRKDYPKAFDIALQLFKRGDDDEKQEELELMQNITLEGKLWNRAAQVLSLSMKSGIEGKELAPYYYLAGRAYFELSRCQPAVGTFESAIRLAPDHPESAEARYRLGKCLLKEKKKAQAKKVWEELIGMKDSFWSPLAQNEIQAIK